MGKFILITSYTILIIYVVFSWTQWFQRYETIAATANAAIFSDNIDLSRTGVIKWEIPRTAWSFKEGEAMLSLVLDTSKNVVPMPDSHSPFPVQMIVSAEGIGENGEPLDRLVRNWYFTTNEPFGSNAKLWSSFSSSSIEYGLGGVNIYPFEKTVVTLNVKTSNIDLMKLNPRLKIVGKHDYAIYEFMPLLHILKHACFVLAIGLLVVNFVLGWKHQ